MSAAGGIPDLTESQRIQLDTAEDGHRPDEPAWTGLLSSVATWAPSEAAAGYVPGATVPDFEKLTADPGQFRGDLFVLEGRYAGRQRLMLTQRSGPWGEALVEWGLVTPGGRVVMVYLVDPAGEMVPPREGRTVRLAARFYKLWTDVDADGHAATYPVFVGRSAAVVEASSPRGFGAAVVGAVVVLAVLLAGVMLMRRRWGGRGAARREEVRQRLRREAERFEENDDGQEGLPDDPAAALEYLERRDDDV